MSPLGDTKQRDDGGYDLVRVLPASARRSTEAMLAGVEPLVEIGFTATTPTSSSSRSAPPAKYVRATRSRSCGPRARGSGYVRPDHVVAVPERGRSRGVAGGAPGVAVYENNQGQMVDDVRLAVLGAVPVEFIGRPQPRRSGFGIAPDLDVDVPARAGSSGVLDELMSEFDGLR